MVENTEKSRARRDDRDLRDRAATPSHAGSAGGTVARDVGSRDEEKSARGGEPEPTRATKKDKIQPKTRTRSDHEGAAR